MIRGLIIAVFISAIAGAQNHARLVSSDGTLFRVLVNDRPVNEVYQAEVVLENVRKDTLYVKIAAEKGAPQGHTLYFMDKGKRTAGKEFNYLVVFGKSALSVEFKGMNELRPLPLTLVPAKPVRDTMEKYRNTLLGHFCELREGRPVFFNNLPPGNKCVTPMPEEYMNFTRLLMGFTQVPDERFRLAEAIARNNCMSAAQFTALLGYVDFEVEKLKLLRLCYFSLTDPGNTTQLEKAFRFESSVNELHTILKNSAGQPAMAGGECTEPSPAKAIADFVSLLGAYANDSQRIEAFRKSYTANCYSTEQAKTVLGTFIHDREKLEAAKLLYFRCADRSGYSSIGELFSYKQSASELDDFLEKQRR
jgi:hypothetical protein